MYNYCSLEQTAMINLVAFRVMSSNLEYEYLNIQYQISNIPFL